MYLNPQDKQHNFNEFAFLSGVVHQVKTRAIPHSTNARDVTYTMDLDESNSFSTDFASSCFRKLESLGYKYPDNRIPGGMIIWINNGILCTLSWFPLNEDSKTRILYSEDSEDNESAAFFCI